MGWKGKISGKKIIQKYYVYVYVLSYLQQGRSSPFQGWTWHEGEQLPPPPPFLWEQTQTPEEHLSTSYLTAVLDVWTLSCSKLCAGLNSVNFLENIKPVFPRTKVFLLCSLLHFWLRFLDFDAENDIIIK